MATYLLAAGLSVSNLDIRSQVEIAGLVVLAVFPAIGLVLTRRAGMPRAGVLVNLLLCGLVAVLAWVAYAAKLPHAPAPPAAASAKAEPGAKRVWIDTDPACGAGKTADVDDCWALAFALRSPELQVAGISTVFGNQPRAGSVSSVQRAEQVRELLVLAGRHAPVFPGSEKKSDSGWPPTPASEQLAAALAGSRLTIVALGPATNLAALLERHPDRAGNIERIVMVAGKPPGRLFHPGRHWWFHFGDFNVAQDVEAMRAVLRSGVPITLVPFELAMQVVITGQDLERLRGGGALPSAIAEASAGWLAFWQGGLIEGPGFSPFDALAVGYVALPDLFRCHEARARIGFSVFLAPFGPGRDLEVAADIGGAPVRYCDALDPGFKRVLLQRLLMPAPQERL